ncbi:MAG: hypothetical protein OXU20_18195 [Myxococcales bacterium]|nr:hypothetical protein [Myxococcales bacterium]
MRSLGLGDEDAEDLLQSFIVDRMPRIAERTRDFSEADTSRYVRAAFRNFVRNSYRSTARRRGALERFAVEASPLAEKTALSGHVAEGSDAMSPGAVANAAKVLTPKVRRAVVLFLGIGTRSHSIREISDAMGVTRYRARQLVVDGLIGAAIALGETGRLQPIEVEAWRRLVLEGQRLPDVADALGTSEHRVRVALSEARDLVAASLR